MECSPKKARSTTIEHEQGIHMKGCIHNDIGDCSTHDLANIETKCPTIKIYM